MNKQLEALCQSVRETAVHANGLLLPVSGGTDSALCFWILNQVYPGKTVGVYAGDTLRAKDWFESVGAIEYIDAPTDSDNAEVMRWAQFQIMALRDNYWLVGARNRSEDIFGTYSLASRVATMLPLIRVWKTTVMELCNEIGVPETVMASSRSADPECGRPETLSEIPLEVVDGYLVERIGGKIPKSMTLPNDDQRAYLDGIFEYNQFKSRLPLRGAMVRA